MSIEVERPKLRPVEIFPAEDQGEPMYVVMDPGGLACSVISVSVPAVFILSLMDGTRTLAEINQTFAERTGRGIPHEQLISMVQQLDAARYLDSPRFQAHLQSLIDDYRTSPVRLSGDEESLGANGQGLAATIDQMLSREEAAVNVIDRPLVGLIAPHLDFARGAAGYAEAYGLVSAMPTRPRRVVILGTNHFGRATAPVATTKDFETPLGRTRNDRAFLDNLQQQLGVDLCEHEYDHQREHSVELQLVILQHLLGADAFTIVPVLCVDPCGPTGTAPYDGRGADLQEFAGTLGDLVRADDVPTLIIAGADMSHVGWRFGDDCELDADFMETVERQDRLILDAIVTNRREVLLDTLRRYGNSTRVCSAGCIYALMAALPEASPDLLGYHQAVDSESGTAVTSSAVAFWG